MGIFRRSTGPSASDLKRQVVEERCWSDPELDAVVARCEGDVPAEERIEASLSHLATVRDDPERLVTGADALRTFTLDALPELRRTAGALSGDPAGRADALSLLGGALVVAAWEVRGHGYAQTVGQDAFRTFHSILEEADEVSRQALEVVPDHAAAGVTRLVTARGLGVSTQEWSTRFATATRSRPTLLPAHWHMLQARCDKWYGSDEAMFDFARRCAQDAPSGDPVGAMLPLAHAEFLLSQARKNPSRSGRAFTLQQEARKDRDLVAAAADRWLAGLDAAAPHPRAPEAHQLFGWFFQTWSDRDRARDHLSRGSLRVAIFPWDYVGGTDAFVRALVDLKVPVTPAAAAAPAGR